ncbi:MAG: protein translocase subunit SecF [Candidatus Pacebacteria bacterium]|nr:protein translocase subunit SecF [Candidatus Paceibacterota bacterium]
MIEFIKHSKIYFIIAAIITIACIFFLLYFGLNLGVDFTGGSILRFEYAADRPSIEEISAKVNQAGIASFSYKDLGEKGVIIKTKDITEDQRKSLYETFYNDSNIDKDTLNFDKIGSAVGNETKHKSIIAIIIALAAIIIYIAIAFNKVSRPVKSWKYGIVTMVILAHDIILPLGVLALLGKFASREFSIPTLTALFTILGYSVNNTIVVFDRVRENLIKKSGEFKDIVDVSINQSVSRCINTSLTTLFPLIAIYVWGGESLKDFSLVLILGILAGTYSALLLAGPILTKWHALSRKR